jgi:type I restriction enzyme R subunit
MANLRGRTERGTCSEYVLPALMASGWTEVMIRPEYAVKHDRVTSIGGVMRTIGDGRVDYVLEAVPGVPTAALEAKREYSTASQGLQQAIRYAQQLDAPLAYSTNGHGFVERNLMTGSERTLQTLPTPAEMWSIYAKWHGLDAEGQDLLSKPFNRNRTDVSGNVVEPRWYQTMAVHRVLRAMSAGQRRILLLMATGTGKTLTAMQIVAKLRAYERAKHPERNYRVLYLADLDVLLKQPMEKDFKSAFGAEPLHRVLGGRNTSREIYFSSYQALTGQGADTDKLFSDYGADFFDLVIVDECHRGSANADGQWRQILDHFTSAVQIGLTATPKRTREIDSYDYFGDPVFEYSLRQGIEDGYLAPYRVRRVLLSPDVDGWQPAPGELDRYKRDIPDGVYSTRDFERVVSLLKRTELAAGHLSSLLRSAPGRVMIFCVDQQHAEDMRAAMVQVNPDMVRADPEWVVRIVGSERDKVRLLDDFSDPDMDTPVVATTSRLLSTGVDVPDLKYVVLFRPIGSMVEFKQIIGRGTRLYPDKGKTSFTIVDYVQATDLFDDPDFDGTPSGRSTDVIDDHGNITHPDEEQLADDLAVAEDDPGFTVTDPTMGDDPQVDNGSVVGGPGGPTLGAPPLSPKLFVDDGVFRVVAEMLHIPDTATGKLRLVEFSEYVGATVRSIAGDPGDLARRWANIPDRDEIVARLKEHDIDLPSLAEGAADYDPLDVLLKLAYNQVPLTRAERARNVRAQHAAEIDALSQKAQQVVTTLLDEYADHGVDSITSGEALAVPRLAGLGSQVQLAREFGGSHGWHQQQDQLQSWLYTA